MQIELADAVAALRNELLAAVARGADPNLTFKVGPVELEFAVELREDDKVKGGLKAWVISAGLETGTAQGTTQRVKVTLTPQGPDGKDLMVRGSAGRPEGPGDVTGYIEP
ncbi:trypco2 family protein [Streptomyces sp. NPDC013433]|uniref:trypco2 family protein n=1 Tax=Streptomyces sp. NPDC013433 TaxID=3155604 RepID=UPI00345230A1